MPKNFDAAHFFEDYYGIIISDEDFDVEPVALRVDARQSNYIRTLPLHHSQIEVERTDEYSIFEYRLCPTYDFRQKLLSLGSSISVLAPEGLNTMIKDEILGIFDNIDVKYMFKVYKK